MMSGHGTIETAVEATKTGAFDYLEKPIGLNKLLSTIARAFKTAAAKEPRRVSLAALGASSVVRDTERALEELAGARKAVLIVGEPGTGHDVAARALQLADAPFVVLANGARFLGNPLALIEEARDGVLYCPEIGQYSKAEQRGLLFLLSKLDKHNVTLVATSSEPLGNLAAEGKFDAALLAQLSAGAVMLPPLRVRRDDIPPLIERFWRESKNGERAPPILASLQPAALTTLTNAHWPGNLDHLANVVSNLQVVRGEVTAEHVKRLLGESAAPSRAVAPEITARFFELPLREAREAFERIYFEQLLGREQSNMSKVAEKAGLERTHLYRKLKQLNIRFSRRGEDTAAQS
jgi:DNA-binding NtrC family response regulator